MKKYDVFLFDADGTLFDYDMAEANALKIMFGKCGFDYSENIRSVYREINSQEWKKFESGETAKDELQVSRFRRLFIEMGVSHDAADFNKNYLHELGKGSFLIEGAHEICGHIASSGKNIYIVTNGILATQKARIEYSSIKNYISDFFVSEFVGFQKPHIKYFEYVFSHIPPVGKDKILIIGDSLTADISGGINAGIDSCWFNASGAENVTGIKPVYEIMKLAELKQFAGA